MLCLFHGLAARKITTTEICIQSGKENRCSLADLKIMAGQVITGQ